MITIKTHSSVAFKDSLICFGLQFECTRTSVTCRARGAFALFIRFLTAIIKHTIKKFKRDLLNFYVHQKLAPNNWTELVKYPHKTLSR